MIPKPPHARHEVAIVGLEEIDPRSVEKLVLRHRRLGQHQEPVGVDPPGA